MRVLAAMSGGVDSSVAALLLQRQGHEVVSVFMRNGVAGKSAQEKSCCSASDARDAALVADRLGMAFYAVDYAREFGALMDHFAAEYRSGRTPNPCVLCNQHLKFGHLLALAADIGADAVATGHYARVVDGELHTARDAAKDQTYYLFGIERPALARTLFPLGDMTKDEVRSLALELGLRTATKPDSQDVCFITHTGGRTAFLGSRIGFRPAAVVDAVDGAPLGRVESIEMVTLGQRRGIGLAGGGPKRYVVGIDHESAVVSVGDESLLYTEQSPVHQLVWAHQPVQGEVLVQCSAHGTPHAATLVSTTDGAMVEWQQPQRRVSPGQSVVFYDATDTRVLGGGIAG